MNTPKPCDTCNHCMYSVFGANDPDDTAYCDIHLSMGNKDCPQYEHYMQGLAHGTPNTD